MRLQDENEIADLDSSSDLNQDETAANSATGDTGADSGAAPTNAEPSPATGENDDADLLSVVRDVVKESRDGDPAAPPAEGEEDGQTTGETTSKSPDDEAFSDVPFHKHPRFKQLLRQRDGFRQDAERYQNVQNFLDTSGLNSEEAADGLIIMALMKTNPVEAWKRAKPTIQNLLIAAGEVLPDDLRQMVQNGKMDETAAFEVSRSRAGVNAMHVQRSFDQQQRERATQRSAATALSGAANDWEMDRRKKDPNFEKKFVSLQKEILFLQQAEGKPANADGVRAQLSKAYKAVNDSLKPVNPQPRQQQRKPELKPIRGGQVAGNNRLAPDSTLDIVRANRRTA